MMFDETDLIHSYTRADALANGMLVDVSEMAKEAGFKIPVAVTRAVWDGCIAWTEEDTKRQRVPQDTNGRMWDVLYMASLAARANRNGNETLYRVYRVPRGGRAQKPRQVVLKLVIGPGDNGEPVITIMEPDES